MRDREGSQASVDDYGSDLTQSLSRCRSSLEHQLSALREDVPPRGALEILRADVSDFASRSRRHDVPPEQLLVLFKEMLRRVSALQGWGARERDAVMHELVQMTIEAYYSEGPEDS